MEWFKISVDRGNEVEYDGEDHRARPHLDENVMPKPDIHPTYYPEAKVTCSCGASYSLGATVSTLKVEICRECHPFYSGRQRLVDTAGRVDRFREQVAAAQARKGAVAAKTAKEEPVEESAA